MRRFVGCFVALLSLVLCLGACSSTPRQQTQPQTAESKAVLTATDSAVIKEALSKKPEETRNLDVAHESFIRAQELELRGEKQLAEVFWQRAYEADPKNRYLAFAMVERLMAHGSDSAALALAEKAIHYRGKTSAKQFEVMARLYMKSGVADSSRKYFVMALDSSHYQDMPLLYDYSLFLEAIQDKKELVRVYDLLLPQVNYIQSLFSRQLNLLLEMGKDSAVVDLFGKAHDATGDKEMLVKMVQGLSLQKRNIELRAIADTITGSTEKDEEIINLALLTFKEGDQANALKFLKKKYFEDNVQTPVVLYYVGSYEFSAGEKDSAKVHLGGVYKKLDKNPAYAAQACRALAGIAFAEEKKKDGVRYAELADSLQVGGDKDFLAVAYGYAGMYPRAYAVLDSMLDIWSRWTPMAGIADSATMDLMQKKADRAHRQLQNTYARVLITEARDIEDNPKADSAKLAYARETRIKAELFWESMLIADSTDLFVRLAMAMNLERLERFDESFQMFEHLLEHYGAPQLDWPELLNYYGYSMVDANRKPEEVEKGYNLILMALESKPEKPSDAYLDSKAWGLYRMGKFEDALAVMLLIKSDMLQDDYVYWEHLGSIYVALGKKADAQKAFKKVLKLRPNNKTAKEFFRKKK